MSNGRKIQVITGGTSGMGKAAAIALGKFGPVLIGGRSEKKLSEAMEEIRAAGVEVFGKVCDVSDIGSVRAFADYAESIAPVGYVVHAAGIDSNGGDSIKILNINMLGTINVANTFLPRMTNSALVNFTSVTGYFYMPDATDIALWNDPDQEDFCGKYLAHLDTKDMIPGMEQLGRVYLAYAASKSFCIYYTKANAKRFAKRGNQIFSIAPGTFDTPMLRATVGENVNAAAYNTAFGRVGTPEEMAHLIQCLLEPGHEYLTGCDIIMDGGMVAGNMVKQLD